MASTDAPAEVAPEGQERPEERPEAGRNRGSEAGAEAGRGEGRGEGRAVADAPVAIVTGGAQGLGLVIARRLRDDGMRVVIADVEASTALPEGIGERSVIADVDVSERAQVEALVALILQHFGRIDVLVNGAGQFSSLRRQRFDQVPVAEWRRIFEVHVEGVWHCCSAVSARMKAARGGSIINIASTSAMTGNPDLLPYVSSQGAVLAMTQCLARGLGEFGIRVNAVALGLVNGDGVLPSEHLTIQRIEAARKARALHLDVTPADIAAAVSYLAADSAAMVTGQTLVVDGGRAMN